MLIYLLVAFALATVTKPRREIQLPWWGGTARDHFSLW